jgi:hypothetical protein
MFTIKYNATGTLDDNLDAPIAIVLILPMCLLASVTGLLARGLAIDILSQIGFRSDPGRRTRS